MGPRPFYPPPPRGRSNAQMAAAVAATAAVLSPQVRGALRRGVVYGIAGVLKAGDAIAAAAREAGRDAPEGTTAGANAVTVHPAAIPATATPPDGEGAPAAEGGAGKAATDD